jgi:catechol 2,3-dioxygenase-like lactoylglutathione lyase family enzyme
MLRDLDISAVIAVKDMDAAKAFYEGKLGLVQAGTDPDGIYYKSGNTQLLVYESQYAGTNQATMAGWRTNDLMPIVEELKSKGVKFEHYDFPGGTREGDIHVMGEDVRAVWFKDPDGNILAIDEVK